MSSHRSTRLLVVAPGPKTRGGISSVIRLHQMAPFWKRLSSQLLSTYDDRGPIYKLWAAVAAYMTAPVKILRADIVHVHLASEVSLLRKLPIVCIARMLRKPLVVHVHAASEESLFRQTPRWAVRFVLLSAARIIALSQSWADLILRYVPEAQVVIIPNPVVLRGAPIPAQTAQPVVLYVGKLEPRKGYADLLTAAPLVLREFPSAQFWFAGHGELEQARTQCERLGIGSSVRLLGWVDGPALENLFLQSSLLTLPSHGEGVPMSVLEAMNHGLPVICTPVGGLPELISDGQNGLFIKVGDPKGLASQILKLLREPAYAEALGAAALETVQQRCGLEIISQKLETLYAELLSPPSPC